MKFSEICAILVSEIKKFGYIKLAKNLKSKSTDFDKKNQTSILQKLSIFFQARDAVANNSVEKKSSKKVTHVKPRLKQVIVALSCTPLIFYKERRDCFIFFIYNLREKLIIKSEIQNDFKNFLISLQTSVFVFSKDKTGDYLTNKTNLQKEATFYKQALLLLSLVSPYCGVKFFCSVHLDSQGRIYFKTFFSPTNNKAARYFVTLLALPIARLNDFVPRLTLNFGEFIKVKRASELSSEKTIAFDFSATAIIISAVISGDVLFLKKIGFIQKIDCNAQVVSDPYDFYCSNVTETREAKKKMILSALNGISIKKLCIVYNVNEAFAQKLQMELISNITFIYQLTSIIENEIKVGFCLQLETPFISTRYLKLERHKIFSILSMFFESFAIHIIVEYLLENSFYVVPIHDCFIIDSSAQQFLFEAVENSMCILLFNFADYIKLERNSVQSILLQKFLKERESRLKPFYPQQNCVYITQFCLALKKQPYPFLFLKIVC